MKLLISFLMFTTLSFGSVADSCRSILTEMISTGQIEGAKLQKFLNLQAGISLHRLAYAGMRHSRSKEQFRIEREILSMLNQMKEERKGDPEFNEVYELFNHQDNKLSRTALASVLPYLKDIIEDQSGEQSSFKKKFFNIGLADVRMLAILAEREKEKEGSFAHAQFKDHAYDQSILNFTKIINSSFANSKDVSKAHSLNSIEKRLEELNKKALKLLEGMGMPLECQALLNSCVDRSGDQLLIDDGFMDLVSKVIKDSDTIDLHEKLRYDDVWLHVNSKIAGTASGDLHIERSPNPSAITELKKEEVSKVEPVVSKFVPVPFEFTELSDEEVIQNYLVQKVLDSVPYFFSREDLEKNMDFTMALAQAIDNGILAKKGRERSFRYSNAIYYLPETWNSEYSLPRGLGGRGGEILSRRWNQFFRFDSDVDTSHIPKEDRDNFLTTLNDQLKDHEHVFSFEFKNKLYDINTGKPLRKGLENFLNNRSFIKQRPVNLAQIKNSPFENASEIASEIKKGKYSYIRDGKAFHISGSPVEFNREYSRASIHANASNAEIDEKTETYPEEKHVRALYEKHPEAVLKLLADRDRAFLHEDQVIDLYKGNALTFSEASQSVLDFRNAHGDAIKKGELEEEKVEVFKQVVAILNEDQSSLSREGWISHEKKQSERNTLNAMSEKERVISFYAQNPLPVCSNVTIIDKQKARLEVFATKNSNPTLIYSVPIQLGANSGDERTLIKSSGETNKKTGAGAYSVGEFKDNQFHLSVPSFDSDKSEVVFGISASEYGVDKIISNPRVTNGELLLAQHDLDSLKEYLQKDCPVLVLPETDDVTFKLQDDQLRLLPKNLGEFSLARAKGKKAVLDFQFTPAKKSPYRPIELVLTDDKFHSDKSQAFLKALEDEKRFIMEDTGLTNEEYNELSKLAFGVLGTESSFGEGESLLGLNLYKFKETRIGQNIISLIKEGPKSAMVAAIAPQIAAPLITKISTERHKLDNSRGVTQIKNVREFLSFRAPAGEGLERYPEITPESLDNPRNAAIATMFALASKYRSFENIRHQHSGIDDENAMDYLYYLYIGSSGQVSEGSATPKFNPKVREANAYASKIKVFTRP